jgi:hypothetical protein
VASGRGALLIIPHPHTFQLQKAEYQTDLSVEVSFVSVLAMVPHEVKKVSNGGSGISSHYSGSH